MNVKLLSLEFRGSFLITSCKIKMDGAHANVERSSGGPHLLGRPTSEINQVCFHSGYPPAPRKHAHVDSLNQFIHIPLKLPLTDSTGSSSATMLISLPEPWRSFGDCPGMV